MDKIARLRQEIERRINILTNVYDEQMERKDEEMMNYYHGKVIALEELRPFLDTLSEEPNIPEFPETFEICLYDGRTPDNEKCTECSTTCSVRKEEPNKSLEEAAEEYTQKMLESWRFDSTGCRPPRESFIAGAEWQASQMPMPEDTVLFQKGVAEGRRLEKEEKDLGWHLSTEHPPVDEEVIVLLGRYEDFPQIAFGHIVDQNIAIDFNGWNIPGVKYWIPMPKLEDEK